jgi:hypothetical protein
MPLEALTLSKGLIMKLSRREAIGLAMAMPLSLRSHMNTQNLVPLRDAVDHLILGCADLQRGIAWFEERTGVRAAIGGSHPGRGTHNALLSLGGRQYLEIIAQDPAQSPALRPDLAALKEPRLIGWASSAADLPALVKSARSNGVIVSDPRDGERKRPDGRVVRWRTAGVQEAFAGGGISPVPFFIEWAGDAVHPSTDSPAGCRLDSFAIEHPEARPLEALFKSLNIAAAVTEAAAPALVARLATSRGAVTIR